MRQRRAYLCDPVTLGFRLMLQTEQRLARRRIFRERAKYLGTMALLLCATVGSTVGFAALVSWMHSV